MFTSIRVLLIGVACSALACDPTPSVTQREAPDVPWPSVEIDGLLKSPAALVPVLEECFGDLDYSEQPSFRYVDKTPNGNDQQIAQLRVEWRAHLDVADCVRRGLLELGGVVSL